MATPFAQDSLSVGRTDTVKADMSRQNGAYAGGLPRHADTFTRKHTPPRRDGYNGSTPEQQSRESARQRQVEELETRIAVLQARLRENMGDEALAAELANAQSRLFWVQHSH